MSTTEEPHYLGHRDRLRQRFRDAGGDAVADYELLELILFRSIPRRDVKKLAKDLVTRFGSFAEVVAAPLEQLREVDGVGESTALDLKIIDAAARRQAKGSVRALSNVSSWAALLEYCRVSMAFAEREEFRVIFLDKRNNVLGNEVLQHGTVDHTPVYPREIIKRALSLGATALILVHNHPSGDPTPSTADIRMTQEVVNTAKPLGIVVHDHLIIGRSGNASFKGLGLL